MTDLPAWLNFALAAVALAVGVWSAWSSRNRTELDNLDTRVKALETGVSTIAADMRHLPDSEATHRLELSMTKLEGQFSTMAAQLAPVAETSKRIQEFLMEKAR